MNWIQKMGRLVLGDNQSQNRIQKIGHLLDYVNNQQVPVDFREIEKHLGSREFRVVSIKLLGWLKIQHRFKKKRPLGLYMRCPWCVNLSYLLSHDQELASIFMITDNGDCDFCDEVSESERESLKALVDREWKPKALSRALIYDE